MQAIVKGRKTSFAAWFFRNDLGVWMHLATFRTITHGAANTGFYSFIEDFRRDDRRLEERRSALFGNGWVLGIDGRWASLTEARFTADQTPVDNIDVGVQDFDFYLATGGNTVKHTEVKSEVHRRQISQQPPQVP